MANVVNYVTQYQPTLIQLYKEGVFTNGLTTAPERVSFLGAQTIRIPYLQMSGYRDYDRAGGFERGSIKNDFQTFTMRHDRGAKFMVDTVDVDETNQALSAANVTGVFETECAIPETDAYRMSIMYTDWIAAGKTADATALSATTILQKFDTYMEAMDEAEVPQDGRIMYVTPAVYTMLKNAQEISRQIDVGNSGNRIYRSVRSLDDVTIVKMPSSRMKTVYDWNPDANEFKAFTPGAGAAQINLALVHPRSVIAVNKHSFINLMPPGTHTDGDGYVYMNRQYWDLFVIPNRADGIMMNVT